MHACALVIAYVDLASYPGLQRGGRPGYEANVDHVVPFPPPLTRTLHISLPCGVAPQTPGMSQVLGSCQHVDEVRDQPL